MRTVVPLLLILFLAACSGPDIRPMFARSSPASPDAPSGLRPAVAAVLAPADPLAAEVCVPDKPCVLREEPRRAPADQAGHEHMHHMHHGAHDDGGSKAQ